MKAIFTIIVLALLVPLSGCASGPAPQDQTPESRLTQYQTVLKTYEKETKDDAKIDQLLAEAESLIRRAENHLSLDDPDSESVELYLDAAEAKLVEISTMKTLRSTERRTEELERTYTKRAEKITELRKKNAQELPPAGDSE